MNPIFIIANDLNDAYFSLLWNLWNNGREYRITSGSFEGDYRLEFDYVSGFIKYPHTRPLSPIMPEGIPPVTTDEKLETDYFPNYLMNPELSKNEHYRYSSWINGTTQYKEYKFYNIREADLKGSMWVDDSGLLKLNKETPLEWVIRHFKEKGYGNNHCYINVGNVDSGFAYEVPYKHEGERRTSPCLRGLDFKIKDGQLITSVVFRSWDLYAGFPENMGGFTLLNEYIADQLEGVKPGPLAFTSAGLHCYGYQMEPVMSILKKEKNVKQPNGAKHRRK
jgi:thymidylate synthase